MSPVTHFLIGWVAGAATNLDRRERTLVALAGVAPDLDGLGIIPELLTRNSQHPLPWFSEYHHLLFHNLAFAVVVAAAGYVLARHSRWKASVMCFVSVHLHLLGDVLGARGPDGYQWPVPYLLPFTSRGAWSWSGEWALNSWQNMAITLTALAICIWFAAMKGFSPVEVFSEHADHAFVEVVRRRLRVRARTADN